MPLPSSGAISFSAIRGEFGGSAPDAISEYYRNGGLVPEYPANSDISESGSISTSDFHGADVDVPVVLVGDNITHVTSSPQVAQVGYGFLLGDERSDENGAGFVVINTWLLSGTRGQYEVRLTVNSGTPPSGPAPGDWNSLISAKTWFLSRTSVGVSTNNCTIDIRYISDILATATVIMTAQQNA